MVGGSCPNVACLPSKNVIYSAKAVSLVHPTKGLGVVTGSLRVDMAGVARRKWQMVNELVEVHLGKFKASGAELVMGEARFTEPKTVQVTLNAGGTRSLRGERVFINVGTRATHSRRARARHRRADDARRSPEPGTPARATSSSSAAATSAWNSPRRCGGSAAASRSSSTARDFSSGKIRTWRTRFWS